MIRFPAPTPSRRAGSLAVSLAVVIAMSTACGSPLAPGPVDSSVSMGPLLAGDRPGDDAAGDGVLHDDLSGRVAITAYPVTLVEQRGHAYMTFQVKVENVSFENLPEFSATLVLAEELDGYLAAGAESLTGGDFDLVGLDSEELADGSAVHAVVLDVEHRVADDEFLDEAGLDARRILELAEHVTLELQWRGGQETLEYTAPVLDPDGLLEP